MSCISISAAGTVGISKFTDEVSKENFNYVSNWALISGVDNTDGQNKLNSIIREQASERLKIAENLSQTGVNVSGNFTFETARNRHGIISIILSETLESSGSTRQTFLKGITFNGQTGKIYRLMELFRKDSNYIDFIYDEILLQCSEKDLTLNETTPLKNRLPICDYYITNEEIVIILPSNEYFSKESGFEQFPISIERMKGMYNEEALRLLII